MSMSDKAFTVFGADTPVGAVVAHALSKSCKKVKAIPLGGNVQIPVGVEIVLCDVTSQIDIRRTLKGIDGCFVYTWSNFRFVIKIKSL